MPFVITMVAGGSAGVSACGSDADIRPTGDPVTTDVISNPAPPEPANTVVVANPAPPEPENTVVVANPAPPEPVTTEPSDPVVIANPAPPQD